MIHVEKRPDDCPAVLVSERAQQEIRRVEEAIGQGQQVDVGSLRLFEHSSVRQALQHLYRNRCAFCESDNASSIHHYRPPRLYPWLVYDWSNLLLTCVVCAQQGADQFPLPRPDTSMAPDDVADRWRRWQKDRLQSEEPLLLHPEHDQPESHIMVAPNGTLRGLSERGRQTIDTFYLQRRTLNLARQEVIEALVDRLRRAAEQCVASMASDRTRLPQEFDRAFAHIFRDLERRAIGELPFALLARNIKSEIGWFLGEHFGDDRVQRDVVHAAFRRLVDGDSQALTDPMLSDALDHALRVSENGTQVAQPHDQHAYVTALKIANIRCFGERRQRLEMTTRDGNPARWTVILGDNGTGKTTLLRAFAVCLPLPSQRLKTHRTQRTMSDPGVSFGSRLGHSHLVELFQRRDSLEPGSMEVSLRSGQALDLPGDDTSAATVRLNPRSGSTAEHASRHLPLCFGYGAARRIMGTPLITQGVGDQDHPSLFNIDAPLQSPEEWLLRMDYAASQQKRLGAQRDRVVRTMIDLLPDVLDIEFIVERERPRVRFQTSYGMVELAGLSLGYQTFIAWVVDLASKLFEHYPSAADPLAMPAICLVDEIDLHLHPRWQQTVMEYLGKRFPNTQFIVTAHSPLIAQSRDSARLIVLRKQDDHVIIDNDSEEVSRWRVDQILTSDLFGLDSAHAPAVARLLEERADLLGQSRLTARDKRRVEEIEKDLGYLPTASTPEEIRAMQIILSAASKLADKGHS